MTKKITVVVSCVLAMTIVFACGYYAGRVDSDTTAKSSDSILISGETYGLLQKYMSLNEIEQTIEAYFAGEYDAQRLIDGAAKGMTYSIGDIYADYYTAEEYEALLKKMQGSYTGIGISMTRSAEDGIITVLNIYKDSPAVDADIQIGDRIVKVGGKDVAELSMAEIKEIIQGDGVQIVAVVLQRGDETIETEVISAEVTENKVAYRMIGSVGYVKISAFEGDCVEGFKEAVAFVESNSATGIVIDLRGNGGGVVDYAVAIADMLLPEGVVVYSEDKYGRRHDYNSDNKQLGLPLAVLVNERSASASEILAGALQDYGVGELVGQPTFGKGVVQSMIPQKDGGRLKITTAHYYTPNGRDIDGVGLKPDYEVENEAAENPYLVADEDDAQLQKALEVLGG